MGSIKVVADIVVDNETTEKVLMYNTMLEPVNTNAEFIISSISITKYISQHHY